MSEGFNSAYDRKAIRHAAISIFFAIIILIALIWAMNWGFKTYKIWACRKDGQAELAHAEYNRKIKVYEAEAFKESAIYLAQAEVERAKGVAQANQIIGESLHNNEAYLRYLWITSLENKQKEIIYIPTEANLPILEASRLKKKK